MYVCTRLCSSYRVLSIKELNVLGAGSLKALRAMRVLRPLKLVSGIPSKLLFVETEFQANRAYSGSFLGCFTPKVKQS